MTALLVALSAPSPVVTFCTPLAWKETAKARVPPSAVVNAVSGGNRVCASSVELKCIRPM